MGSINFTMSHNLEDSFFSKIFFTVISHFKVQHTPSTLDTCFSQSCALFLSPARCGGGGDGGRGWPGVCSVIATLREEGRMLVTVPPNAQSWTKSS